MPKQTVSLLAVTVAFLAAASAAAAFEHPAGWHTRADIARVRSLIASGKEPWCV